MQVQKKQISDTKVQLHFTADADLLTSAKHEVLQRLNRTQVKIQGFRAGKAPLALVEKQIDPAVLQSEFLDAAANKMYAAAIAQENLRPVSRPEVTVKKFVPFTTLEVEVEVEVLGAVTLPDYTKIKLPKKPVSVTNKDVDEVIEALRTRAAEKQEVSRAATAGDEAWIDFVGTDAKSGEPIQGADGKDYPLMLGSDSFIPGFEDNLIGVKVGEEKVFTLAFPKDYGVKALQSRKVTFKVTVTKINELAKPQIDDAFAAKVGPFKTVAELKADVKKQVTAERETEAERAYESELIEKIVEQSKVPLPQSVVEEEVERLETEERQNLVYRDQTWQEHLAEEGVTETEHREQKRPQAENRVKAGLILSEIAEREKITVSTEELEIRLQILRGQYQDKQMQAELDKPENRRDILSRMMTEKTLEKLKAYAAS